MKIQKKRLVFINISRIQILIRKPNTTYIYVFSGKPKPASNVNEQRDTICERQNEKQAETRWRHVISLILFFIFLIFRPFLRV